MAAGKYSAVQIHVWIYEESMLGYKNREQKGIGREKGREGEKGRERERKL